MDKTPSAQSPFGMPTPDLSVMGANTMLDIIWNTTALCWADCAVCCVAARQVKQKSGSVLISSSELTRYEPIADDGMGGSTFDRALRHQQRKGLELTLEQKLRVLDNLAGHQVKLDISGGDALLVAEGYILLEAAARRLGRDAVTLTSTGTGLTHYDVASVAGHVGELNITFDGDPDPDDPLRPAAYARNNLRRARKFAEAGISTRAECPLSAQNLEPDALTRIYLDLHEAGIDKLLLMRLFPVGRGTGETSAIPTNEQYKRAIATLRQLEARYGSPKVKLQCALRLLDGPSAINPCDAVTGSFGLMWDGTLLGSPWAINKLGKPIDPAWVLGNLAESPLGEILSTTKVRRMRARAAENHGSCKIFAWLNGTAVSSEDRMFQSTDPMYATLPVYSGLADTPESAA